MSQVLTLEAVEEELRNECHRARNLCTPSFVFSVEGQVGFRSALDHLAECNRQDCQALRGKVISSMKDKLTWLMREECLLGCVQVQTLIYGVRKPALKKSAFSQIAKHLSSCPHDSCAQLRRALMLNIRDNLRPG